MINSIQQHWRKLQTRERLIVVIGLLIVLLAIIWFVFSSQLSTRSELKSQRQEVLLQINGFQERAQLLSQIDNSCPDPLILEGDDEDILKLMASRQQVSIDNIQTRNKGAYILQVVTNDGDSVLRYAHQLICQGFSLGTLQIQQNKDDLGLEVLSYGAFMELSRDS